MAPDVLEAVKGHNLADPSFLHDDLQSSLCVCRGATRVVAQPIPTGEGCAVCGGLMVRTGTCHTCTSCGTSGGCG